MLWCGRARRFIGVKLEKAAAETPGFRFGHYSFVFILCRGMGCVAWCTKDAQEDFLCSFIATGFEDCLLVVVDGS